MFFKKVVEKEQLIIYYGTNSLIIITKMSIILRKSLLREGDKSILILASY